jgi:hypothetical protein
MCFGAGDRARCSEPDRILGDEPYQQPRNTSVYGSKCRAGLPRTLAGASRSSGRENKCRSDTDQESRLLAVWPGQSCNIEHGQIAELGAASTP